MSLSFRTYSFAVAVLDANELAGNPDSATRQTFHLVDQAQKGGLARPAGAKQTHDFSGVDGEVDPFQDLVTAERLGHIDGAYEVVGPCRCGGHFALPTARPLAASSLSELTCVPNLRPNRFSR
jgi:hypothetical protein